MSADNEVAILNVDNEFYLISHLVSCYLEDLTHEEILKAFERATFCSSMDKAMEVAREIADDIPVVEHGITYYQINKTDKN